VKTVTPVFYIELLCLSLTLSLSLSFSDAPVSELSLELLLLQVVLPALLEQGHTRQWLKGLVRAWTMTAGYLLWVSHPYLPCCPLHPITLWTEMTTFPDSLCVVLKSLELNFVLGQHDYDILIVEYFCWCYNSSWCFMEYHSII